MEGQKVKVASLDRALHGRELRDSLFLLALTVSSLSAYVGLGVVAVRLFAAGR